MNNGRSHNSTLPLDDEAQDPQPIQGKAKAGVPQQDAVEVVASTPSEGKSNKKSDTKKRVQRSYPASSFEDALFIPMAIQSVAAGQKVARLTLFDEIKKSPDSSTSRMAITNANKYGLITGNYTSEYLELTTDGAIVTSPEIGERDKIQVRFQLGIEAIKPFKELYEQYINSRLPVKKVMLDFLKARGYSDAESSECVDTFIVNAKYVGILKTLSGVERIIRIAQVIEELPDAVSRTVGDQPQVVLPIRKPVVPIVTGNAPNTNAEDDYWANVCFYITPIGEEGSEVRKHSDLFLHSIVEPALDELGIKVVRADKIDKPGMITSQIIQYIIKSRLIIADLSFHNPNVFYELALSHSCRRPTVHIIRKSDRIPFDIDQARTIVVDDSSVYALVPQIDVLRSEIANQVRRALEDDEEADNPITVFCPGLRVSFD